MARIEIWQPKYKTDECLIDPKKVAVHNTIWFSKANHLLGKEYYISGEDIRKHKLVYNGRIMVHAVPMSELELIREEEIVRRTK